MRDRSKEIGLLFLVFLFSYWTCHNPRPFYVCTYIAAYLNVNCREMPTSFVENSPPSIFKEIFKATSFLENCPLSIFKHCVTHLQQCSWLTLCLVLDFKSRLILGSPKCILGKTHTAHFCSKSRDRVSNNQTRISQIPVNISTWSEKDGWWRMNISSKSELEYQLEITTTQNTYQLTSAAI